MNWTELVAAVAELSPDAEQQLLQEARSRRSEAMIPGPGTEHPPIPTGAAPAVTAEPDLAAEPVDAELVPAPEPTAATPPVVAEAPVPNAESASVAVADIVRPTEPPAAGFAFSTPSAGYSLGSPSGMPRDDGVPTMDEIREKIEGRFARAEGQAILDAESEAGRQRVDDEQTRAKAAEDVLAKIRASINKP